jgi:hypothetical protein
MMNDARNMQVYRRELASRRPSKHAVTRHVLNFPDVEERSDGRTLSMLPEIAYVCMA